MFQRRVGPSPLCVALLGLLLGCGMGLPHRDGGLTCTPAPSITGNPPGTATAGFPYAATFTGSYNCGLWTCFSIEGVDLPSGAVVDEYAKAVFWTPPASMAGTTQNLHVKTSPDFCGASADFRWSVQVLPAPAIEGFEASPATVRQGQTTRLTAFFSGGDATLETGAGTFLGAPVSGLAITSPPLTADTVFILKVTNPDGAQVSRSLTVQVPGLPVIYTFGSAAGVVTQGQSITLFWDVAYGNVLRVDPGGLDVTGLTSLDVKPAVDTVYTLTAGNGLGDAVQATAAVQVVAPPRIDSFTATPPWLFLNAQAVLTATFTGSGSIEGIGPVQSGVGVLTRPLLGTTSFVLTVTNAAGATVAATLPVEVRGPGTFQPLAAAPLSPRMGHTATLLPDGTVFLAGGNGPGGVVDTTERFDPVAGTFTAGPRLTEPRVFHQAVLLPGGKVLLAGGRGASVNLFTAEVVDPAGASVKVGDLPSEPQQGGTSAPLPGGDAFLLTYYRAARYLGASGTFQDLGSLPNVLGSVAPLKSGKVLVVNMPAWTFDPVTGLFSDAGSPTHSPFWTPAAVTLADGRVLACWDGFGELWDPATGAWRSLGPTGLAQGVWAVAVPLLDGRALVLQMDGSRVYNPATDRFELSGNLASPRSFLTATTLPDGRVLVVGGEGAELYAP